MYTIKISEEFSETPGARYKDEGDFSGEEFREEMLIPKFLEAKKKNEQLGINFDGSYGYPTSFLEEAFGGLSRLYGPDSVINTLVFYSEDEPTLIEEVKRYIIAAKKEKK